ncbi:MAG: UbiA-like polyprenyltransferase [Armatimonadota bacterium]|nr:UbiA-like polyprenyltransferase [Armatimonadota bacterium]
MRKLLTFLETIRFEHTIFALPFAYMSLLLAMDGLPPAGLFGWITLAMVSARTIGMAVNRLVDVEIDRRNPRTSTRPLVTGRITTREVILYTLLAGILFLVSVYHLAPLTHFLWPVVLAALICYPYAKRFTWLTHFALGAVYLMIPPAVWIAATNTLAPPAVFLGLAAATWVAGFDILYALQDVEVDRKEGIHSIPADFGVPVSLVVARWLHAITVFALFLAGRSGGFGSFYLLGVGVTAALLAYEHAIVRPDDLSRIHTSFFTMNGLVSVALFLFALLDRTVLRSP